MSLDDAALAGSDLDRLRRRDLDALGELISRYQHRLYRYLVRFVQDTATAEDLFQQTWLNVLEKARSYDPARSFDAWLFAIAHNLVMDHFRRRRPQSLDDSEAGGVARIRAIEPDAFELFLRRERSALVAMTLRTLPAVYREVLTLRFEDDMKLEEIAHVLGIPVSTVKSRLHRALVNLRGRLESRFVEAVEK